MITDVMQLAFLLENTDIELITICNYRIMNFDKWYIENSKFKKKLWKRLGSSIYSSSSFFVLCYWG